MFTQYIFSLAIALLIQLLAFWEICLLISQTQISTLLKLFFFKLTSDFLLINWIYNILGPRLDKKVWFFSFNLNLQ